jgi:hypothetical protein
VVLKEVSRNKQYYYGFDRGEQGRNSILMVLKEVSRKETIYINLFLSEVSK